MCTSATHAAHVIHGLTLGQNGSAHSRACFRDFQTSIFNKLDHHSAEKLPWEDCLSHSFQ